MKKQIDKSKERAVYKQLYDYFVESINNGVYCDGDKLPSRRELERQFGVSETTVLSACRLLENTGYLTSVPRKGYYIKSSVKVPEFNPKREPKIFVDGRNVDERIAYSYNGTDNQLFKRSAYARIVREIAYNDEKDILRLGDKYGEQILRNAIAKYLYSFRGLRCNPDNIIIGAGSEYTLVSLAAVLGNDTLFAVESPGEMRPYCALEDYGKKVVTIPPGCMCNLKEELEACGANVVYTFPSFHFPDGYVMSDEQKSELIEWANTAPDKYIIEDDRDFGIIRHKNKPIFEMDKNSRTIYFGTFIHSISSSFKISYMVLPDELHDRWIHHHRYYHSLCSKLEQYALAEFISTGEFVTHYRKVRDLYRERRKYFKEQIKKSLNSIVEVLPESDATSVIVKFNLDMTAGKIRHLCAQNGIKIYNISMYTPDSWLYTADDNGKNEPPVFIFGIGHLSKHEIKYGAELMGKVFEKL